MGLFRCLIVSILYLPGDISDGEVVAIVVVLVNNFNMDSLITAIISNDVLYSN